MKFWRFFTGVLGSILFLSIPLMLFTGMIFVLLSVSILLILFSLIAYFLLSVYMIWWGFIEKEQQNSKDSESPSPLKIAAVVSIILLSIILLSTKIYITYKITGVSGYELICDKNRGIVQDPSGTGMLSAKNQGASQCTDYETSEYKLECKDSRVIIACKATIWDAYISKKK